ncbi:Cytochrome c oxidase subunit 6B [Mortierella alpina]|nr:Cytochrome c oxidase subunit 6B [Mortierella alpina]
MPNIEIKTAPFDTCFPNTNQGKYYWQAYSDYHRYINSRGEEFAPCQDFKTF